LFRSEKEFANQMIHHLNLNREEIKFLVEEKRGRKERSIFDFSIE
jgi:hypothetical protein